MALIITGIDDEPTRSRYVQLRGRLEAQLPPGTEICVAGVPVRRTLKLLSAVARGQWVVSSAYLSACFKVRKAIDPSPFELVADVPGCRRARVAGGGTALAGLEVVVRGPTTVPAADLVELLRDAGATVRQGRDVGSLTVTRLHPWREALWGADEGWLLEQIMRGGASTRDEDETVASSEENEDGAPPPPAVPFAADLGPVTAPANAKAAAAPSLPARRRAATITAAPPPPLPKRPRRGTSSLDATGESESAAHTAASAAHLTAVPPSDSEEIIASTMADERSSLASECRLLPPPAPETAGDFTLKEALAIRLYRQRLPACNVDLRDARSPRHPALTPRRRPKDGDFLQLLVHGSGARTAVASRTQKSGGVTRAGDDGALLYGACTFIPHPSAAFCELQLLAVAPRYAGRGLGSRLLAAVEGWLCAQGVTHVVALAGLDTVDFWRKKGYCNVRVDDRTATTAEPSAEDRRRASRAGPAGCKRKRSSDVVPETSLTPQQWALVRDPFGSSKAMMKRL